MYTLNKKQAICIASLFTSAIVVLMSSCANHDFDWDDARDANPEYQYLKNFEYLVGSIDPNMEWDFSTGGKLASTRAGETTTQIIDGLDFGIQNTATSDGITSTINTNYALYQDVSLALPDGQSHTGKQVVLTAPGNPFTIYPISCQGAWTHDLYVKIGDNEAIKVYSKDWTDASKPYVNGMGTEKKQNTETSSKGTWVDIDGKTTNKKIYKITNKAKAKENWTDKNDKKWALSGASLVKESEGTKYAIIKRSSDNKYVLFSISSNAFLRIDNNNLSTTQNIAQASAVEGTNGGSLKIGNKYLYHITEKGIVNYKSNGLGLANSYDASSDNYKWDIAGSDANNNEKQTVNNAISTTTAGSYYVSKVAQMNGITINAPVGTPIQIYVKASGNGENLAGTATGNVIYVAQNSTTRPVNVPSTILTSESQIRYVGIEDQLNSSKNGPGGDKDYNDITLCIIGGPNVPQEIEITSNEYDVPVEYSKRYMVEDMGYSDIESKAVKLGYTDIDFNDIVVDLSYIVTTHHKITKTNGVITGDETSSTTSSTTATVRALGGTWDFKLLVNNTPVFRKGTAGHNGYTFNALTFNPNYKINNIPVTALNASTVYNTNCATDQRGDGNYNHTLKTSSGAVDDTWICKFTVSGWSYTNNNIAFELIDDELNAWNLSNYGSSTGEVATGEVAANGPKKNVYVTFPEAGACPKIIAFDTNKIWKQERVHVTTNWFLGVSEE